MADILDNHIHTCKAIICKIEETISSSISHQSRILLFQSPPGECFYFELSVIRLKKKSKQLSNIYTTVY